MSSLADWVRARLLRLSPAADAPRGAVHPFDVRHGVDTSGLLYPDKLPSGHAHDRYSEGYYATAPSVFHGLLEQWRAMLPQVGLRVEDYTLVDLGCGKGRVLMLASMYRFRAVIGLELNAGLVRVARRNLRRFLRRGNHVGLGCRSVRVERVDVLDFDLPEGPVVLFLFNSFGEEMVRALVEKLRRAAAARFGFGSAGPIDLLYVHPDHDALVAATPAIEILRYTEIRFSEEDAAADVFGVSSDICSIYRMN
jgi:SAM-dependent methyltransferase